MVYGRRNAPKRVRRVRRARRVVKRMPKVSAPLKQYIKKAISRSEETKFLTPLTATNLTLVPYDATSQLLTLINLTTGLQSAQGTGQGDRIGDEINIKSLVFRGFVTYQLNPNQGSVNAPLFIKMVIGRLKSGYSQPTSFSNLFQAGSGVANPTNLPIDMIRNFNKDAWIIYHQRMFKIGFANLGVTGPADSNNDFSLCKMFKVSLAKHVHKLKYSDAGTSPTNVGLYCWFLLCRADGNALTGGPNAPTPEVHYTLECAFKDS